jgi:hypothetical protein
MMNLSMIALGTLLTFISGAYAIAMVIGNGKVSTIPSILFFVGFNLFSLRQMSNCRFPALYRIDMNKSEVFRQPIVISTEYLWSSWNLNGLLVPHYAIFDHVSDAVNVFFVSGDRSHVDDIGEFDQLKAVIQILNSLNKQQR